MDLMQNQLMGMGMGMGMGWTGNPYRHYAFYMPFYPGVEPVDYVSRQAMQTTLEANRRAVVNGVSVEIGEDQPAIGDYGLFTCGAYVNQIQNNTVLNEFNWHEQYGLSPVEDNILLDQSTDESGRVYPTAVTVIAESYYTVSAKIKKCASETTNNFCIYCYLSGATLPINRVLVNPRTGEILSTLNGISASTDVLDDEIVVHITVYADVTSTAMSIYFYPAFGNNINLPDATSTGAVEVVKTQCTNTRYPLPFFDTESSIAGPPENYSDADQGYKIQLVPDELGAIYSGNDRGPDIFTEILSVASNTSIINANTIEVTGNSGVFIDGRVIYGQEDLPVFDVADVYIEIENTCLF